MIRVYFDSSNGRILDHFPIENPEPPKVIIPKRAIEKSEFSTLMCADFPIENLPNDAWVGSITLQLGRGDNLLGIYAFRGGRHGRKKDQSV